jgi:hypothetical protein
MQRFPAARPTGFSPAEINPAAPAKFRPNVPGVSTSKEMAGTGIFRHLLNPYFKMQEISPGSFFHWGSMN